MRNPNGFGSVVKLKGRRRRPYRVQKTIGYNDKGHPIIKIIGYAATKEEGIIMLSNRNQLPYDKDIKFSQVYRLYSEERFKNLAVSTQRCYRVAFNHCADLHDKNYQELKLDDFNKVISDKTSSIKSNIRSLLMNLDSYCIEHDIILKGYAQFIRFKSEPHAIRQPFTIHQIKKACSLCAGGDHRFDGFVLLIYTGYRISELLQVKIKNVDIENFTITGGVKTNAGKNRIVPIHPAIRGLIDYYYDAKKEYLFPWKSEYTFYQSWNYVMGIIDSKKTPHTCRHTFESLLDSAGANRKCIDMLMGHASQGVGLTVYTHKTLEDLREAISLIPDYLSIK